MMKTAYIALGSNLGDRLEYLRRAASTLAAHPDIILTAQSRIYETAPIGGPAGQGAFLNAVIQLQTTMPARTLLTVLQSIEEANGRMRTVHWGPRTLDLDLLLYGDEVISEPDLTVPHPRLAERNFVLAPLSELAPDLTLPGTTQTIQELQARAGKAGLTVTELTF